MKRQQTSLSEAWSKTGPTSSKKPTLALEAPAEIERQDETAPISSNEYDTVSSAVVSDPDIYMYRRGRRSQTKPRRIVQISLGFFYI